MAGTRTFTIIKPDAVSAGHTGAILDRIIKAGFRLCAMKYLKLSRERTTDFYDIHREKPFFGELLDYMTSGPIVIAILEKENAVAAFRDLIGATDPSKAAEGTIRRLFASSISANAIHGSDSDENAQREGAFFFTEKERF